MAFDPAISLRLINNERLHHSQGWAEYRDLGGALAVTSDAPTPDSNHIAGFTSDDHRIEGLLDIGFALLRAFDREPAAIVTPLDRPASLADRLRARGMTATAESVALAFEGEPAAISVNSDVSVRRATPDDAPVFAAIATAGAPKWARTLVLSFVREAALTPANIHYLAVLEGQPVGTLQLLVDGHTAGIYAAATLKAHRRRGVCSTLLSAAVADARSAGCDVIGLQTAAGGDARVLFESLGFVTAYEFALWTAPQRD